jgi:hypothetical protein
MTLSFVHIRREIFEIYVVYLFHWVCEKRYVTSNRDALSSISLLCVFLYNDIIAFIWQYVEL